MGSNSYHISMIPHQLHIIIDSGLVLPVVFRSLRVPLMASFGDSSAANTFQDLPQTQQCYCWCSLLLSSNDERKKLQII